MHFWEDTTGNFGFEHFHSLSIHDGAGDDDNNNDDSDSDSDDDDVNRDDDKGKEAVFTWSFNSGQPVMASGYLGLLREWFSQGGSSADSFN